MGENKSSSWGSLKEGLFGPIDTSEQADKLIKDTIYGFYTVTVIGLIASFFVHQNYVGDILIVLILTRFLSKSRSRFAAFSLVLYSVFVVCVTFSNRISTQSSAGGKNIFLSLIVLVAAVIALRATFKYHQLNKTIVLWKNLLILNTVAFSLSLVAFFAAAVFFALNPIGDDTFRGGIFCLSIALAYFLVFTRKFPFVSGLKTISPDLSSDIVNDSKIEILIILGILVSFFIYFSTNRTNKENPPPLPSDAIPIQQSESVIDSQTPEKSLPQTTAQNYYLVVKSDLGQYRGGTTERFILKFDSQNNCIEDLKNEKNLSKGFISAECLPEDGVFLRIFNNQSIGNWYLRLDPFKRTNQRDRVLLYSFKDVPDENTLDEVIKLKIQGIKKVSPNQEIYLISPNGKVFNN